MYYKSSTMTQGINPNEPNYESRGVLCRRFSFRRRINLWRCHCSGPCQCNVKSQQLWQSKTFWIKVILINNNVILLWVSISKYVLQRLARVQIGLGLAMRAGEKCRRWRTTNIFHPTIQTNTNNVGPHGVVWEHPEYSKERARLLGLSQRALNEGNTNAVVFVTGDQVLAFEFL